MTRSFKDRYGEVFCEYRKFAFDKEQARRQEGEFVAPGHPLLEAVIERLLATCSQELKRGATFADPDDRLHGLLWFLELEVRDGLDRLAGKRLYAVYQDESGRLQLVNPSILWDLKPLQPDRASTLPAPDTEAAARDESRVIEFAVEIALEAYRHELLQQRQRDAQIKRKYGLRSLEHMIAEVESRLAEHEIRRAQGEPVLEATLQKERRRKEELQARRRQLAEQLERELMLTPATPHIAGVARVVPAGLLTPKPGEQIVPDHELEKVGMELALQYERQQGRSPEDVSALNLGYDIRSSAPNASVRYIEVKTRARTGAVALTPNEWLMAQRLEDDYWLYVVENAATEHPVLYRVQNPASRLTPREVVDIVRYVVRDWKAAAEIG